MLRNVTLALALTLTACGDDTTDGGGGSGGAQAGSDQGGQPNEGGASSVSCTGTFKQLQKDAYRETAGRSGSFWPPHTTTTLSYTCSDAPDDTTTVVMANHGTLPDAKDANGDIILEETASASFSGSKTAIDDLVAQYEACQCDGETLFLSIDSLGDEVTENIVGGLLGYFQENLVCPGPGGVDQLVMDFYDGEIELVIETLPTCEFTNGTFEEGLNEALAIFLAESEELLGDYHVCNNDAVLQAGLIDAFISGQATDCDATSAACHGPLWFYDPTN